MFSLKEEARGPVLALAVIFVRRNSVVSLLIFVSLLGQKILQLSILDQKHALF